MYTGKEEVNISLSQMIYSFFIEDTKITQKTPGTNKFSNIEGSKNDTHKSMGLLCNSSYSTQKVKHIHYSFKNKILTNYNNKGN